LVTPPFGEIKKKVMYYVIFSADPYLLARMATDLQMEGGDTMDSNHPFESNDGLGGRGFLVYDYGILYFIGHNGIGDPTRFTLTPRNYLRVLGEILNNKNKA